MKKNNPIELDFVVDKLTNSIENVLTGDVFPTSITWLTTTEQRKMVGSLTGDLNLNNQKERFINNPDSNFGYSGTD